MDRKFKGANKTLRQLIGAGQLIGCAHCEDPLDCQAALEGWHQPT
jgi:hypothetical protein